MVYFSMRRNSLYFSVLQLSIALDMNGLILDRRCLKLSKIEGSWPLVWRLTGKTTSRRKKKKRYRNEAKVLWMRSFKISVFFFWAFLIIHIDLWQKRVKVRIIKLWARTIPRDVGPIIPLYISLYNKHFTVFSILLVNLRVHVIFFTRTFQVK